MNNGASLPEPKLARERVLGIQRKLHKWAKDDQDRRFQDLHNLVCDPAMMVVAWERVRTNRGSRSAGVDGQTAAYVEKVLGVDKFLGDLREELRSGSFRPSAVKQRSIPKRGGKLRYLGIATVRDRVVQAALKLVLEPIFEVDFEPCSYGFRPGRRAWDAIAEVRHFSSRSYEWILEADIKACFDELDHSAILGRVRRRVVDKRVLGLIKAFLKAGILTEQGSLERTITGTPQGGILSPLMANVALSALDEHYARAWEAMGQKWHQRDAIRRRGGATYRLIRYADDFVICVAGERRHAEELIAQTEQVIAPLGLTLSMEKTRVVHIDEGIDFLGWRIKRQQRGSDGRRFVYTYPSKRSLMAVKAKVRQITRFGHNQTLDQLLHRLNPVLRGWCAYFRCGVSSQTFSYLDAFAWRRVVCWLRRKYPKRNWRWLIGHYLPGWSPTDGTVTLFRPTKVATTRYRYRGAKIATPWEAGWIARRDPVCGPEHLENLVAL
ncbi:MAG: group II intron reverse transcriptase/maturase [Actinomycetota bacterium]|nr:group II intron reverse transcriptase/maturase [Actinomycetota bacterium]